jgi:hypothetical protein
MVHFLNLVLYGFERAGQIGTTVPPQIQRSFEDHRSRHIIGLLGSYPAIARYP